MLCAFIPPYLLRRIAALAADDHVGQCGRQTLALDRRLRVARESAPPQRQLIAPAAGGRRVVHDAGGQESLPGRVVRRENDPATGDLSADEAFEHAAVVWDLFEEVFERSSVDGRGTTLSVTVHYGQHYDNAFWDGRQLVFGDGDGEVFDRFTKPMDVMAHEFTHGVTQFTAGLVYADQSGALNESISDVFAAMARQRQRGQTADQADWLIGEGLFRPGVQARALRSMIEPGTAYDDPRLGRDPQVASMADYNPDSSDNGGVHVNSGIPNRAFALAARALGGPSWEVAGRVWYAALTSVDDRADFATFAQATIHAAAPYGRASVAGVTEAWRTVGVLDQRRQPSRPRSSPQSPDILAVQRTGGFTGRTTTAELDLNRDPRGPEVRSLLDEARLQQPPTGPPAPDRFVYTLRYRSLHLEVAEPDLSPALHQVVRMVMNADRGLG